jgi:predicted metal-dependent phosphoesterase TrpH
MDTDVTRADMHVHSSASDTSKLGVQRSVALPECATSPEEVYEQAKRRGMAFVTITDHDTLAGVQTIADRPDVFVSEELTVGFRGEPQAVHVLCYGITPDDHDWLQAHNADVEACAEYLSAHETTAALAHPFYAVAAPLTARHRRGLAELFPIWETRDGSRAKELNLPTFVYIETRGGTGIGGSDDHAGVDIGRTYTETPRAATPAEFLAEIRAGRTTDLRRPGRSREVDARGDRARPARPRRRRARQPCRPGEHARNGRAAAARGRPPVRRGGVGHRT